jgi:hypothetical protein
VPSLLGGGNGIWRDGLGRLAMSGRLTGKTQQMFSLSQRQGLIATNVQLE